MSLPTNAYWARHGGFFCLRAVSGEGTTESFSAGFAHGRSGSRAAAPKQSGSAVCARDGEPPASRQAATSTRSPSRRKAGMIPKDQDVCRQQLDGEIVRRSQRPARTSPAAASGVGERGLPRGLTAAAERAGAEAQDGALEQEPARGRDREREREHVEHGGAELLREPIVHL